MANAQSFIFWNSVFYIPLAVLIIYRYTIQGLGYSGLAMFAGVAEMVARAMVGFWFVPLWGYFAACIANPVAWFFACFFLIPAYLAVRKRLMNEKAERAGHAVKKTSVSLDPLSQSLTALPAPRRGSSCSTADRGSMTSHLMGAVASRSDDGAGPFRFCRFTNAAEKRYTINNYVPKRRRGEYMAEQELEQLEGTVEDIIYENADNGYTVFEVSGGGVMTVVCGVVGELHAGESGDLPG